MLKRMKNVSVLFVMMTVVVLGWAVPAMADRAEDLIRAAMAGDLATVQAIIAEGARVNAKSKDGWTALMAASANGHRAVVQALLAQGADVNAKDRQGRTALTWASFGGGNRKVVDLLQKAGATG